MTASDVILDKTIRRQVELQQYVNGLTLDLVGLLNSFDEALFGQLLIALDNLPAELFAVDTLEQALAPVLALNEQSYVAVHQALRDSLDNLAEQEADFNDRLLRDNVSDDKKDSVVPLLWLPALAAALQTPYHGLTMDEWTTKLETDRAQTMRVTIRNGYLAGESSVEIVNRVRGDAAANYENGLFQVARNNLATDIRGVVSHVTEFIRRQFYADNAQFADRVVWISVLDSRTSQYCILRSGKLYGAAPPHVPLGHDYPWGLGPGLIHFNCRSSFTPVLVGDPDPNVPTYDEWLRQQPAEVQDQVLGPARAKMYRAGDVSLPGFANDRGRWLRLDELS